MMMRLLLDVSSWLYLALWPSLHQIVGLCCLSWFLHLVKEQCITSTGSRSLPILDICPNHVSLHCAILSTNVFSWCRVLRTVSFFIPSCLVTRNNLLSHVISATRIFRLSSFLRHQHSEPYNTIATTKVSYNFTLVIFEIFLKVN